MKFVASPRKAGGRGEVSIHFLFQQFVILVARQGHIPSEHLVLFLHLRARDQEPLKMLQLVAQFGLARFQRRELIGVTSSIVFAIAQQSGW